jgi:uncharacterized membrane protein
MIGSSLGAVHLTVAVAALAFGAIVLGAPKGTALHRTIGAGYVVAMVILNVSALGIYRLTGHFQPFHALALLSLATIVRGMVPALRRRPGWLMAHYWNMAWSYLALLAAACSEIVVRLLLRSGAFTSPWQVIAGGIAIAVVFVVVGMVVLPRLQRTAMAQLAERSTASA